MSDPVSLAREIVSEDPDPETRAELEALLKRAQDGDEAARRDLADRFSGPLEFGTAGLRGRVEAGLARVAQRAREPGGGLGPDRLDREPLTFHQRVRQGYRAIAAAEPTRVRLIPAAGPAEEIHQLVVETVRGLFA